MTRTLRSLPFAAVAFALSPLGAVALDHSHVRFDQVLGEFAEGGLVDYAALLLADQDPESAFSRYLRELASDPPEAEAEWSRHQRLAYWINAYNAFTLKLIVDHYPINTRWYVKVLPFLRPWLPGNSILQIKGRWKEITFDSVRGPITLHAIEHDILRPEFREPRIHFAIVCASIGCPALRSSAFHGDRVLEELDAAAIDFMTDPAKVTIDNESGKLRASRIFEWFRQDFDGPIPPDRNAAPAAEHYGQDAGAIRWISAYAEPAIVERIEHGPHRLSHLDYDWHLNEKPRDDPE